MRTLVLMDIAKRVERLQQLRGMGARPPDFDAKVELLRRVNLVAEKASALGEMPQPLLRATDEVDQARFVSSFHDWVNRR
jgi:hypothetical protein